jgi:hypothetical protein
MTINQYKEIDIIFLIDGYSGYGFGSDKSLYNLKTGRKIKKCLKAYTRGFNLSGKFISQHQIKPLLRKVEKINCPF